MAPLVLSALLVATATATAATAAGPEEAVAPFGFRGMEIFAASAESICLRAADLNGDGLKDLVYVDNSDATIRLLLQVKPGETAKPGEAAKAEVPAPASTAAGRKRSANEIDFDKRFRAERFFTEKRVTSLAVGDFDGDGKPDLAYYGDPKELEVVYQAAEWGLRREKFAIADGAASPEALCPVDLNGDGRIDLVLLGQGKTYILEQRREGGGLGKPRALFNSFTDIVAIRVGDLDGDQRPDFLYLRPRATHPFVVCFQGEHGFGPQSAVKSLPVFQARLAALDGENRTGILTIQGNTRRIRALRWGPSKEIPKPVLGEPRFHAFRSDGDPALRRLELGDVDGDGRTDLVVSSSEAAELDVSLQDGTGALSLPIACPTLAEVKSLAIGDLDGDGKPEVAVVSAREKALGVSRWAVAEGGGAGRLLIPESYPVEGEPLLVAAGRLDGKTGPAGPGGTGSQLVLVHKASDGKFHLSIRELSSGKKLAVLGDQEFDAGAEPSSLVLFDADGDGRLDAMVFVPYEDPRLFVREDGPPAEGGAPAGAPAPMKFRDVSRGGDFGIGQISRLAPQAFSLAVLPGIGVHPGPALMVTQKSYARALQLEAPGKLRVLEQFSGRGAQADLLGAAALDLDEDPEKEVLLFDKGDSSIGILDRTPQGTYGLVRSIQLPGIEFGGFRIADLDGDGREDVAVLGKQAIAILSSKGGGGDLEEIARFDRQEEPSGQERILAEGIATGDLNADGRMDLVVSTGPHNLLEFLTPEPGKTGGLLCSQLSFPVFEERSFHREMPVPGPREILASDIDGDGKTDLVLLIHNRILFYPQD